MNALLNPSHRVNSAANVREIADGIYLVRMRLPFRLDHINLYLLEDLHGWTLVDCGLNDPHTMQSWQDIFAHVLRDKPINRIILTHLHPDHIGLAAWLQETLHAEVHITPREWDLALGLFALRERRLDQVVQHYRRFGFVDAQLEALVKSGTGYRSMVRQLPRTVVFLHAGQRFRIGHRDWEIVLGRGHSPECACLWNAEAGLLIGGDHVLPSITPNLNLLCLGSANPLGDYLDSLTHFSTLPCRWLLPAHGEPGAGYHERIAQIRQHHAKHMRQLMTHCLTPKTVAECLPLLFGQDLPEQQRPIWFTWLPAVIC